MSFDSDLTFSHAAEDMPCWREIYAAAFPTMSAMVNHRANGDHQRAGIDRSVILDNSKQVLIDEKARRIADTGDIMLEFVSVSTTCAPGWVEKPLLCDYIAYAFLPSGRAYLLPVIQLQAAWRENADRWKAKYGRRVVYNKNYQTHCCPVPTDVLYPAIGKMLRAQFTPMTA